MKINYKPNEYRCAKLKKIPIYFINTIETYFKYTF